jgi:hypothetical protein
MPEDESPTAAKAFADELARARLKLRAPERRERVWPPLAAALMFAICAMSFATAAILAPPVQLSPMVATRAAE